MLLPHVDTKPVPETGGAHRHQIEAPPGSSPCCGPPASVLAPTFDPLDVVVFVEGSDTASAKLSFAGAGAAATLSTIAPVAGPVGGDGKPMAKPSTAML